MNGNRQDAKNAKRVKGRGLSRPARRLRKPLFVLAVLVAAWLVMSAGLDWRIEQARRAMRAGDNPTTIVELESLVTRGDKQTAMLLDSAARQLSTPDRARLVRMETQRLGQEPESSRVLLQDNFRVIRLLMQAATRPEADLGFNPRSGLPVEMHGPAQSLPDFRRLLQLQARELARAGRPDSALRLLGTALRMTEVFADPVPAYHAAGLDGLERTFEEIALLVPAAGQPALERLILQTWQLNLQARLVRALRAEAVLKLRDIVAGRTNAFLPLGRKFAQLRQLEVTRRLLDIARQPWHKNREVLVQPEAVTQEFRARYLQTERAIALQDLCGLGLRVLLELRRTGSVPQSLADIVVRVPLDRFSGREYGYCVEPTGFTVSSAGPDGIAGNEDDLRFRVDSTAVPGRA